MQIELIANDGHEFGAWVAEPTGSVRGAVVIVQEIFGVNAHIRAVTRQYADAGYVAAAPMLFDRVARGTELNYDAPGVARGRELVAQLGFDNALRDVAATATWAHARSAGVAVIGYCWGGTVALLACCRLSVPAVSYYGGRSMDFLGEQPQAPLMLHFGAQDALIPPEHVEAQRAAFARAQVHVYAAGHGFNCTERADHDAPAAALAFSRSIEFLGERIATR